VVEPLARGGWGTAEVLSAKLISPNAAPSRTCARRARAHLGLAGAPVRATRPDLSSSNNNNKSHRSSAAGGRRVT
jgi:hypothetical protein